MLNEEVIREGRTVIGAFERTLEHSGFREMVDEGGAVPVLVHRLACMDLLRQSGLGLYAAPTCSTRSSSSWSRTGWPTLRSGVPTPEDVRGWCERVGMWADSPLRAALLLVGGGYALGRWEGTARAAGPTGASFLASVAELNDAAALRRHCERTAYDHSGGCTCTLPPVWIAPAGR